MDIPDQLDGDSACDEDGIRKCFALDVDCVAESVDFDLEVIFVDGDGIVEGAEAEDGVGLDLGDGDGVAEDKGIGGF